MGKVLSKEVIIDQLKTVIDPHIGIDVWSLGFIYEINIINDITVHILMTLTTPACPLDSELTEMIRQVIEELGVDTVTIEKTFDPPWQLPATLREKMGI